MCKSIAEGGQRCPSHARERLTAAQNREAKVMAKEAIGKATPAQLDAAREATDTAWVEYASTMDGAADLRARLASERAKNPSPLNMHALLLEDRIDDGARLAQANREVENAYRAQQGKPPLKTPMPLTFAQETEQRRGAEAAAEADRQQKLDPLGLRAEQAQNPQRNLDQLGVRAEQAGSQQRPTTDTEHCGCLPPERGGRPCAAHAAADLDLATRRMDRADTDAGVRMMSDEYLRAAINHASIPSGGLALEEQLIAARARLRSPEKAEREIADMEYRLTKRILREAKALNLARVQVENKEMLDSVVADPSLPNRNRRLHRKIQASANAYLRQWQKFSTATTRWERTKNLFAMRWHARRL